MRNYITLNGKNSNEINGLLIQELPPISKPQIRTEVEEIDGRDGDIVTKLGFAAYDKEFTVGLYKNFDINAIIAYFNSEGTVVFSNEPDKYYNYQIIDQIDFERLVRYRTATVRMHCQPFKYSNTEGARTLGNKGTASGEGSFITLDNTPEAQFSKIDPKGNATQTTYSGKNLFDKSQASDGWLDSIGNIVTGATWKHSDYIPITGGATYTTSGITSGSGSNPSRCYYDASKNFISGTKHNSNNPFTNTAPLNAVYMVESMQTADIDGIQIELGSTATSYEPYVGGTASPNPDYPQAISTVTGENTVKIEGKNLFDKDNANILNAYIDSSHTSITSNSNNRVIWIPCQPNTTYTLQKLAVGTNWITRQIAYTTQEPAVGVQIYSMVDMMGNDTSKTYTTGADAKYLVVRIWVSGQDAETFDAMLDSVQIELGSQATAYEPYQGQEFEVNLGKNLIQNTGATQTINGVTFTHNSDGSITASGTATNTAFYPVADNFTLKAGTYTLGSTTQCTSTAYLQLIEVTTGSPVLTNLNGTSHSSFTTTGDKTARLYYRIASGAQVNLQVYPQLEKGSTATSYAPYFTPIELAKIGNYQDRIYKTDGKWYIEKQVGKVVLDGSESWSGLEVLTNTTGAYTRYNGILQGTPCLSNYFIQRSRYEDDTVGISCRPYAASLISLRFSQSTLSAQTIAGIKTWLGTHNTTVYYALAEPVDEEITNETLISQLEALYNQAHAYKGRTHVAAIAQGSNAPHIIEAEVQRSSDGNITNNGNIVSKPTLTIYGSGNIGVSLNGYQILEITLGDEEYITIDTAAMEAYKDTLDNLKNRLVNGDYSKFALRPGSNMIEFSGTVSKCVISKYSRWL